MLKRKNISKCRINNNKLELNHFNSTENKNNYLNIQGYYSTKINQSKISKSNLNEITSPNNSNISQDKLSS